jgi:phosphoribosylanthranilate isomerase
MEKVKLKICGMRDAENIQRVASLQPDMMGFIFYVKSPRYVGEQFKLPEDFPPSIKRVGVFVNESSERVRQLVNALALDYVQLHGNEYVEQCEALRDGRIKVIKVFSVDDQFDFERTRPYEGVADFFLFDTKGKYYGGNAQPFDWSVLKKYNQRIPFFLSGGLNPGNVADAIAATQGMNLFALDINSGVEESPGVKDLNKIKSLKEIFNETLNLKTKTI